MSSHLSDALAHLRLNHPALLRDVAGGERTLWVGSGVSRDQVPPLEELLAELIRYLQAQPGSRDEGDAHFVALKRIVEVHFAEQFDDFLLHPLCWRPRQSALRRAVNSYSEILAVEVDGQDDDYLLWDGIDIRKSYGSDSIDAGPDRQLIAMLIRERVVNAVVTTNWDGLIEETALAASATDRSIRLAVHMTNENFQTEARNGGVEQDSRVCSPRPPRSLYLPQVPHLSTRRHRSLACRSRLPVCYSAERESVADSTVPIPRNLGTTTF